MKLMTNLRRLVFTSLLIGSASPVLGEPALEGTWRITSYLQASNQQRYPAEGYLIFGPTHWLHVMYLNRDPRNNDYSEAHHGTYRITGVDTLDLSVDLDMHMDPKREFQDSPVVYKPLDEIRAAKFSINGDKAVIDFPSTTRIEMEKLE